MKFEVYDNGRLASHPYHNVFSDWVHPKCETFNEAQEYAKKWLGEFASLCPTKPNQIVDYSGCGDIIEIRSIV